jgi:Protein of unknown function (DUF2568)
MEKGRTMLAVLKGLNLGVAFLLELAALAAFGYWGAQAGGGTLGKIALAVGAPLLVAVVWGLFLAPRAVLQAPSGGPRLSLPWRLLMKVGVFGTAAVALYAAGQPGLAVAFALLVAANLILAHVWGQ